MFWFQPHQQEDLGHRLPLPPACWSLMQNFQLVLKTKRIHTEMECILLASMYSSRVGHLRENIFSADPSSISLKYLENGGAERPVYSSGHLYTDTDTYRDYRCLKFLLDFELEILYFYLAMCAPYLSYTESVRKQCEKVNVSLVCSQNMNLLAPLSQYQSVRLDCCSIFWWLDSSLAISCIQLRQLLS